MRKWIAVACLAAGMMAAVNVSAQKNEAQLKAEEEQAEKLYHANNFVGAKPLFEDLYAQKPNSLIYKERLAMCLLATTDGLTKEQTEAQNARAKNLLLDAQKNGDNSPLLTTLLEKMEGGTRTAAPGADSPSMLHFSQAEKLFSAGDLKGAFGLYKQALDEDPKFYLAALYAGDSSFKLGDCPTAGSYYAKAIAIDPNHETAYRYYGDCLVKMKDMTRARDMYINALLCQPYQKTTNQTLAQWAQLNHARIVPPAITLPKRAQPDAKGNTNITIDMSTMMDPQSPAWFIYLISSTVWEKKLFAENYPKEKKYRHSLAEETSAIRSVLALAKEKKLKAQGNNHTIELLAELDKEGMLECWILLQDADAGIAQDYVTYMPSHRELLQRYVVKYDIHSM